MAYLTTANRMLWCYDNHIRPSEVTAVSGLTGDAGFPLDNLRYDDPNLEFQISTTSGSDRVITFQMTAGVSASCVGIANHNLCSQGYDSLMVEWSTNGTTWNNVGTGSVSILSGYGDPNFFIRFDQVSTPNWWRITIGRTSGTRLGFRLGFVFLGVTYEVTRNPVPGQYLGRQQQIHRVQDTMGGARWLAPGATKIHEDVEISFRRAPLLEYRFVEGKLLQGQAQRVLGIVQPEQLASHMPIGQQHFFGYLTDASPAPQDGPSSALHKVDYTVALIGAI